MTRARRRPLVVCYYRVSTADQSIESQREPCRANAERLAPAAELREISDVASAWGRVRVGPSRRSGSRRRRRAPRSGWSELMSLCEAGRVERVVVAEVSRIARDVEEGVAAVNKLDELGVPVYVVRGGYDSANRRDRQAILFELVHSETEGDWLSERTRAGMAKPGAGAPGRPRAIDDDGRRRVAELRTLGYTYAAIAEELGVHERTVRRLKASASDADSNPS